MERKWPESARWTENDISERSYRNRERIDASIARAMSYLTDPEKKKRIGVRLCVRCYYSGGTMAGQAFTSWNCRVCLKDQINWPNTNPPLACNPCAEKYKICKECGADIYMRVRRNNTQQLQAQAGLTNEKE